MQLNYTVFRKKHTLVFLNTPLCFLLYLCEKCLDFHKIFRESLEEN